MNIKHLLVLFITALTLSCSNDDNKQSIDYVQVTQERLISVSDQEFILDQDIESLNRLIEKVNTQADKDRFNKMLEDVKKIKDIIPNIVKLKTDEDINFTDLYDQTQTKINELTDVFKRKEKLKEDLIESKEIYNAGEVVFDNTPKNGRDGFGKNISEYLKEQYNIDPVNQDRLRYKRADIDKVDSIIPINTWHSNILKFKNLKHLSVYLLDEKPTDFSKLEKLKYLEANIIFPINVDGLNNLENLVVTLNGLEGDLEFTGSNPKLKKLEVTASRFAKKNNIKKLVVKNKPLIEKVRINTHYPVGQIVVEGNGQTVFGNDLIPLVIPEIGELTLSGMKEIFLASNVQTGKGGSDYDDILSILIKKINIQNNPNLEHLFLARMDLTSSIDLGDFPKLKKFVAFGCYVNPNQLKSNDMPRETILFSNTFKNFDKVPNDIESFLFSNYEFSSSLVLDFSRFSNLKYLSMTYSIISKEGFFNTPEKLILKKDVYDYLKANVAFFPSGVRTHKFEVVTVD